MTRIRDRFGESAFARIFEQLISRWKADGHIRGRRIVVDASLVEADAANDSLVDRDDADPDAGAACGRLSWRPGQRLSQQPGQQPGR